MWLKLKPSGCLKIFFLFSVERKMIFSKKISVLLVAALCLAMGATPAMAANQKDEGRAGVPTLGTDKNGKIIVPKTLDDVPAAWCPSSNPKGWDHAKQMDKGWTGFACSQNFLSISGDNITFGLFDKDWGDNTAAPGAKNLAYDMLYALAETKINQGMDNPSAWGTVNQISQKLHGANAKGPNTSSVQGFLGKYDDPAMAIFFDTINRCGCVMQMNLDPDKSALPESDPERQYLSTNGNLKDGCPGAATVCGSASPNIVNQDSTWGPNNAYNKSFQDLAKVCVYLWNTFVNNSYNKKNGITDTNDPKYTQICDPLNSGLDDCKTTCKNAQQVGETCDNPASFVGPGLVSNGTKTWEFDANGNCKDANGKIDIVAQ